MSDEDDVDWDDDDEAPPLDTEEGRDAWIEFLAQQDGTDEDTGWMQRQAMVVRDDENMIVRFKYDDGREEIFDLVIRRKLEILKVGSGESN